MAYIKLRPRRGTAAKWTEVNPLLAEGEIGFEVPDEGVGTGIIKMKMGDGSTRWNNLPYSIDSNSLYTASFKNPNGDDSSGVSIQPNTSGCTILYGNSIITYKNGTDKAYVNNINEDGIHTNGAIYTNVYQETDPYIILYKNFINSGKMIYFTGCTSINPIGSPDNRDAIIGINPAIGSICLSESVDTYESTGKATGIGSLSLGKSNVASGKYSIAIGNKATASGEGSVAIGRAGYMGFWYGSTTVSGNGSVAIGKGINSSYDDQIVLGRFNSNKANTILEIGAGYYSFAGGVYNEYRKNGLEIYDDASSTTTIHGINVSDIIEIDSNYSLTASSMPGGVEDNIINRLVLNFPNIADKLYSIKSIKNTSTGKSDLFSKIRSFKVLVTIQQFKYMVTFLRSYITNTTRYIYTISYYKHSSLYTHEVELQYTGEETGWTLEENYPKGTFSSNYGSGTISAYKNQFACGQYNDNQSNSLFEIGNGTGTYNRSNAFRVTQNGNIYSPGCVCIDLGLYAGVERPNAVKFTEHELSMNRLEVSTPGMNSVALGIDCNAEGDCSSAFGECTTAANADMMAIGKYNLPKADSLFEIGNGTVTTPSNAFRVDSNGNSFNKLSVYTGDKTGYNDGHTGAYVGSDGTIHLSGSAPAIGFHYANSTSNVAYVSGSAAGELNLVASAGVKINGNLINNIYVQYKKVADNEGTYPGLIINGSDNTWVRTPIGGLLPYNSGGASSIGSAVWPFNSIYGTTLYEGGTSLSNKYLSINGGTISGNISFNGYNGIIFKDTKGDPNFVMRNSGDTAYNVSMVDSAANFYQTYEFNEDRVRFHRVVVFNKTIRPNADDNADLGTSTCRWSEVFSKKSAINTSDKNLKENIVLLSENEKYEKLFDMIEPVSYTFKNVKGDDSHDRVHTGMISQQIEDSLKECDLTDKDFAAFCKDFIPDVKIETDPKTRKNIEIPLGTGKYMYSLRYEEFIALNIMKTQKHTKEINELKETIELLKQEIELLKKK